MQENTGDLKIDKRFLYLTTNFKRKLDKMELMKLST